MTKALLSEELGSAVDREALEVLTDTLLEAGIIDPGVNEEHQWLAAFEWAQGRSGFVPGYHFHLEEARRIFEAGLSLPEGVLHGYIRASYQHDLEQHARVMAALSPRRLSPEDEANIAHMISFDDVGDADDV